MESRTISINNNYEAMEEHVLVCTNIIKVEQPFYDDENSITDDDCIQPLVIDEKTDTGSLLLKDSYLCDATIPVEEEIDNNVLFTSDNTFLSLSVDHIEVITPLELTEEEEIDADHKMKRRRKQKAPVKTRVVADDSTNGTEHNNISDGDHDNVAISMTMVENSDKLDAVKQLYKMEKSEDLSGGEESPKKRGPKKTKTIFSCIQCNKTFNYKCNLQLHAAVHSSEKQFSCSICAKSFKLKVHLDAHRKVHNESYDYQCEVCGKEFKYKGNLKTHIKAKHLEERLHECTHCDMTFKMKQHLYTHTRLKHSVTEHLEERLHECTQCDMTFKMKQHLYTHTRLKHTVIDVKIETES